MWMRRCFVDGVCTGFGETELECLEGLNIRGRDNIEGACCAGRTYFLS